MDGIVRIVICLSLLVFASALIDTFLYQSRHRVYIKNIVFIIIILVLISLILNIDFEEISEIDFGEYEISNEEIWESSLKSVENEFENQILKFCASNGLSVTTCKVTLKTDFNDFEIESITIAGNDASVAKNLIVGHFNINPAYINISGET